MGSNRNLDACIRKLTEWGLILKEVFDERNCLGFLEPEPQNCLCPKAKVGLNFQLSHSGKSHVLRLDFYSKPVFEMSRYTQAVVFVSPLSKVLSSNRFKLNSKMMHPIFGNHLR